jgi:dolichyl-phosphate-mannose-protein mannosyltransferase
MRAPRPAQWAAVLVVALVIARTLLAVYDIDRPGVHYDEALFVNAANEQIGGHFITHRLLGVPVMLLPYIGALKSYIYFPLFSLFDVSALSIRLPSILIAGLGLVPLFLGIRRALGPWVGLICVAVLAFDNSLLWLTRDDVGPSSLEFALKCAAIYAAVGAIATKRMRYVVALLVVCAAGLFNKLNFVWYVNALAVLSLAYVFVNRQRLRALARPVLVWLGGLALLYGAVAAYSLYADLGSSGGPALSLGTRLHSFGTQVPDVLDGTWFFSYALGPRSSSPVVAGGLLFLFCVGIALSLSLNRRCDRAVRPFWVATLLIAAQVLLTPKAGSGWHYLGLFPFFQVTAAYGLCRAASLVTERPGLRAAIPACAVLALLAYDGWLYSGYARQLGREPHNVAWSPAIYALNDFARRKDTTFFSIDWGIHTQLLAFQAVPGKYKEAAFELRASGDRSSEQLADRLFSRPDSLYVLHRRPIFRGVQERFRRISRTSGHPVTRVKTIFGPSGEPVFDLYRQSG